MTTQQWLSTSLHSCVSNLTRLEIVGLTVLHVDKDFELIGELTGLPNQRLEL